MSEESIQDDGILVIAFVEEEGADNALEILEKAKKEARFDFWDAAVIRKDVKGHYHFKEIKDSSVGKGAGVGALVGGVLGILGGPAGVALGASAGAAIGGFAASADGGLKSENLEELGHALQSGNSALVIVSNKEYLTSAQEYVAEENLTAVLHELAESVSHNMVHGQNAAYLITVAGRSISLHQLGPTHEVINILDIVIVVEE
jgi:uncharacterized membrane protein